MASQEPGPDLIAGLGGSPGKQGQGAAMAHCGDKDTGGRGTGECSSAQAVLEAAILTKSNAPTFAL